MAKSKPLHWQEPETINCPQCDGSGEFRGMFSSGPCAMCDGTGLVGEDGEPLPREDLLAMMRRQRDHQYARLKRLWNTPGVKEAVEAHQARKVAEQEQHWRDGKGHGAGGRRYTGD